MSSHSKYFFARKAAINKAKASKECKVDKVTVSEKFGQPSIQQFFGKKRGLPDSYISDNAGSKEPKKARLSEASRTKLATYHVDKAVTMEELGEYNEPIVQGSTVASASDEKEVAKSHPKPDKPTPLEKQVMELKERYPDMILFIECGYRYRFFGEDANVVAKVFNITAHMDRMFLTASVPTFNGYANYVRKLVTAGYKVGIVSQTETAAEKKCGQSSGMFSRDLTSVFTRTTYLGDEINLGMSETLSGDNEEYIKSMMMAVTECSGEKNRVSIVAVQPSSGQIVWDDFYDDAAHNELEQRLNVIQPVELLLPEGLSDKREQVLRLYGKRDAAIRFEKVKSVKSMSSAAKYLDNLFIRGERFSDDLRDLLPAAPDAVRACFALLLKHLDTFGMGLVMKLSCNVMRLGATGGQGQQQQQQRKRMFISAPTLRGLELFQAIVKRPTLKGTLIYVLNKTRTRFGARMLKDWVAAPLTTVADIRQRQDVVEYLLKPACPIRDALRNALHKLLDLEVALMSALYRKMRPQDFVRMCQAFQRVVSMSAECLSHRSPELPELLSALLESVSAHALEAASFLRELNTAAAKEAKMADLFVSWHFAPNVLSKKEEIDTILSDLDAHRANVAKTLGVFQFNYACVSGQEFLIEVQNSHSATSIPDSWLRVSHTKRVTRYRDDFINAQLPRLQYAREQLEVEARKAWKRFLERFSDNIKAYQLAVQCVAQIDCLCALAAVSSGENFCRPTFVDGERVMSVENGRNPVVESVLPVDKHFVPNDTQLSEKATALLLTGPNTGGKSCYLRQQGYLAIMAQIGCFVPATSARMPIFDAIHIRTGARDDIWAAKSTLLVELEEAAYILNNATENSLVLIDELGRGTSTQDGSAIAQGTLQYLLDSVKCFTIFITHFRSLSRMAERNPLLVNGHMGYASKASDLGQDDEVILLYKLTPGPASSSFGLNVARWAGIPEHIVGEARFWATYLELQHKACRAQQES